MGQIKQPLQINLSGVASTTGSGSNTYSNYKDLREWGSIVANTADKQPLIQQAINDCIALGYRRLRIPGLGSNGMYHIQRPVIGCFFYNGNYVGWNLEIFGDGNMWDAYTQIKMDFNDGFGIGIQHGKGVTIRGLAVVGQFVVPTGGSAYNYYRIPFENFTDNISRDSRYSPNAAFVIDPFSRGGLPSDGGYPGLSSYYRGTGGQGGSTAITIDNCISEKTVVGVCCSPNGSTRNAEIITISNHQFKNHKLCVSGSQSQEKANKISNAACWYDSHTFFATQKYGAGNSGHWIIDRVNQAAKMVQFIDNVQEGYFPTEVSNVYTEGLGRWGNMQNNSMMKSIVRDCMISFVYTEQGGGVQTVITGDNSEYHGCTFRVYGSNLPLFIQGGSQFNDCVFSGFPIAVNSYWFPRFVDCKAQGRPLGLTGIKVMTETEYFTYGDYTLETYRNVFEMISGKPSNGFKNLIHVKGTDAYTSIQSENTRAVVVTPGTNGSTATFFSVDASIYIVGIIKFSNATSNFFGVLTSVAANSQVTVAYIDPAMISGDYNIFMYLPLMFKGVFIGDITADSNQITNCKAGIGQSPNGLAGQIGAVLKNPYGGSKYIRITSVSGTTLTFYGQITSTQTDVVFGEYSSQDIFTNYDSATLPGEYLVKKGDKVTKSHGSENAIEYRVTKGGFLPGDADTRQAVLQVV